MSVVGSFADIEKVDIGVVNARIAELEKKIEDRRKSIVSLYNSKLDIENKRFLDDAKRSQRKDEVCLAYLKRVKELHTEFQEKC